MPPGYENQSVEPRGIEPRDPQGLASARAEPRNLSSEWSLGESNP
jgi:hypothetical protein